MSVRTYEVTLGDLWPDYRQTYNERSAGKARYCAWLSLRDAGYETVRLTDLRVRSLGGPRDSDRLTRVALYRGRPELHAGARVSVGGRLGNVVDADESANFVIVFDDGGRGSAHTSEIVAEAVRP